MIKKSLISILPIITGLIIFTTAYASEKEDCEDYLIANNALSSILYENKQIYEELESLYQYERLEKVLKQRLRIISKAQSNKNELLTCRLFNNEKPIIPRDKLGEISNILDINLREEKRYTYYKLGYIFGILGDSKNEGKYYDEALRLEPENGEFEVYLEGMEKE